MKTRTLLLLSVATALMILAAGGVFLLQLAGEDDAVDSVPVGESTRVGDMTVVVNGGASESDVFIVSVTVGGVDDADGADSFRLVTGDRQLAPMPGAERACGPIVVELTACELVFDTSAVESSSRLLVARRGDQQRSWALADG